MKIYVRVTNDYGLYAWLHYENGEAYLVDKVELCDWNTDEFAGTAFTSVAAAKNAGKKAKSLASFNGEIDPKVSYFEYVNGKEVEVKFTTKGQIKR